MITFMDDPRYKALFELIAEVELAARNGHWMTCGTKAKKVTELAFKYGNDEPSAVTHETRPQKAV
jgi:hypothetical protein